MKQERDFSAMGRLGAASRNAKLSAKRRSEIARAGGLARAKTADYAAMGRSGGRPRKA